MTFTETKLKGAFLIGLERREDERGFFARAFCQNEFRQHGLKPLIAQANVAHNRKKGTLRGMHFQYPRRRDQTGALHTGASSTSSWTFQPGEPRHSQHVAVELNEDNMWRAFVPGPPTAHQVLHDNTDTSHQVGEFCAGAGGLRYDDRLGLEWPAGRSSQKDQGSRPRRRSRRCGRMSL